jgi:O-phospho-L-seryl-tRNASec:L-selenocysteinyl-tRNA synthase
MHEQVLWPRIDQKTCLKSIVAVGLTPVVIPNLLEGDEVRTDVAAIAAALVEDAGRGEVLCVVSTTSCFAPRAPERVAEVAALCRRHGVAHLVNNAYGCQSRATMAALDTAARRGRVDGVIQSLDKNFLVPVGGAILASISGGGGGGASGDGGGGVGGSSSGGGDPDYDPKWLVGAVAAAYPGRASGSAVLDLFITLLSMVRRRRRRRRPRCRRRIIISSVTRHASKAAGRLYPRTISS